MDELRNFIKDMRQQQLSDELIYKNLIQKGWDERLVNEAFLPVGTVVPVPSGEMIKISKMPQKALSVATEQAADGPAVPASQADSSLDSKSPSNLVSGAQSALHHIFLWVFSLAFIVNIQIIIQVIIEQDFSDHFGKTLASSVAILLITGVVYWLFYFKFVKAFKQNNRLRLRGGWTVATIVLSGLTAIGSLIGLVISLIWSASYENIIRLAPIILYSCLIVLTYAQVNFAKSESNLRKQLIQVWYCALVCLLLATSMLTAGLAYLSKKSDLDLKKEVAVAASKVHRYYKRGRVLPKSLEEAGVNNAKLKYRMLMKKHKRDRYEICANFRHSDYQDSGYYGNYVPRSDGIYVDDGGVFAHQIKVRRSGQNCFKFEIAYSDYSKY